LTRARTPSMISSIFSSITGSRAPAMDTVRQPIFLAPSSLIWYFPGRNFDPFTRTIRSVSCSKDACSRLNTPPGPGRRYGLVFSYSVWAATDSVVQRRLGLSGSTRK